MTTETATPTTHPHKINGAGVRKTAKRKTPARASRHMNRLADALSHGDVATLADGLSHQLADMKDKGMQTAQTIEKGIAKNPKSSVLVAFGVGYVLARLGRWL